jgi:hypothetical protein
MPHNIQIYVLHKRNILTSCMQERIFLLCVEYISVTHTFRLISCYLLLSRSLEKTLPTRRLPQAGSNAGGWRANTNIIRSSMNYTDYWPIGCFIEFRIKVFNTFTLISASRFIYRHDLPVLCLPNLANKSFC